MSRTESIVEDAALWGEQRYHRQARNVATFYMFSSWPDFTRRMTAAAKRKVARRMWPVEQNSIFASFQHSGSKGE